MLAGLQRGDNLAAMQIMPGGDHHHIDAGIGNYFLLHGGGIVEAKLVFNGLGRNPGLGADPGKMDLGQFLEGGDQGADGELAGAQKPDTQRRIPSHQWAGKAGGMMAGPAGRQPTFPPGAAAGG